MKRFFWILLCVPLAMYALFFSCYARMITNMADSANDYYANIISNNCSDAATDVMLDSADLGQDYANTGAMTVDPDLAVREYGVMMALANGYQPTEDTINSSLRENVTLLYVCGYDGYYVYTPEPYKRDGDQNKSDWYGMVGTFKLPYTYVKNTNELYALTLNGNLCTEVTYNGGYTLTKRVSSGLTQAEANSIINTRLSDDMNKRLTDISADKGSQWRNQVYIPAEMSNFKSTNPITSPTVMAFLTNIKGSSAFGIGGTKITNSKKVVAYERDGHKYYCYASDYKGAVEAIVSYYDSIDKAAAAGYSYDPAFLIK